MFVPHTDDATIKTMSPTASTTKDGPKCRANACLLLALFLILPGFQSQAQLVELDEFSPGLGGLVSVGLNPTDDLIWLYGQGANIHSATRAGVTGAFIDAPGENANDVDIDFATEGFTLNDTFVPPGTMLFINGESGTADVYAVNASTGTVLATLTTSYGASHVVGGAYHRIRKTLYLVADRNDSGHPSTIAEIDPVTGSVLQTFGTTSGDYTVNYGDIDISDLTGDIYLVSSDENRIRILSATGAFVADLALPTGISSLSGIAIDDAMGEAFLCSTSGTVWRVGGQPTAVRVSYSPANQILSWPSAVGLQYTVEYRNSLDEGSWMSFPVPMDGTGNEMILQDSTSSGLSSRFYRLLVTPKLE